MVLLSGATSNLRKGGVTTRGGGNTEELFSRDTSNPTNTSNGHWWNRAADFVKAHPEGVGKVVGATAAVGAGLADTITGFLGKKTDIAGKLKNVKKDLNAYVKDEQSGFGKFMKGFTMTSPEKQENGVNSSNGHVATGYDRIKPYYISPSVNRRPHMFSQEVANEWKRHKQHTGELPSNDSIDKNRKKVKKIWKKWKKWKKHNPKKKGSQKKK